MERADLEQWKAREVARLLALVGTERRYYQDIVASVPVGLLVLAPDLAIISANAAIRTLFNLSGSPLRARLDKLLPPWLLDRVSEVLKTGVPQTNILISQAKTGRRLRIGIVSILSWDDESSPEALLSIEDLSGLGDVGVPVPVAAGPLNGDDLLNELNAATWTLDLASTNFSFVSRGATRLLGYPAQHWTSNASFWTDRVYTDDRDWVMQSYRQAIQRGEGHACEFRTVAADGRILWVRESARLVTDGDGRPRYLIGITVDVTERHMLQDQLVQSERTQAVSKLAGRMAHDLNNMLMIVTGHGEELLNSLPAGSPLRADVQEIMNATERMSGVTGHLLAFTRRPAGTVGSTSLDTILRTIGDIKQPGHSAMVIADAERLLQILKSLIEHEQQVSIETSVHEVKEDLREPGEPLRPGLFAVITITLPGRAWQPDAKKSWFEAVLPVKDAPDDFAAALTRGYGTIRQWGGDMAVSANAAGGTVLRVYLAIAPQGAKNPAASAPVVVREPGPETIMVVDDESGIRELVHKILERHGYQVLEASNGEEALALWREYHGTIDLLITDVLMPRMGGAELVDRLRKQGLNPKVVYVSGYNDDPNIYAGNFPPGTAFLQKPFTLGSLLERVREVLKA